MDFLNDPRTTDEGRSVIRVLQEQYPNIRLRYSARHNVVRGEFHLPDDQTIEFEVEGDGLVDFAVFEQGICIEDNTGELEDMLAYM